MIKLVKWLLPADLKTNVKDHLGVPSLSWTLNNLKKIGYQPKMVLDIGAYQGYWTRDLLRVFPEASILMIEGQESKRAILSKLINDKCSLEIALLSTKDDELVSFVCDETNSRIQLGNKENLTKTRTLKSVVDAQQLVTPPDFIKIDIQGHEIEAMNGGIEIVKQAEFVLLECTVLDLDGDNHPVILDIMNYMDKLNFQLYDISQFMRRPLDLALFQVDALFIRRDSVYIKDRNW